VQIHKLTKSNTSTLKKIFKLYQKDLHKLNKKQLKKSRKDDPNKPKRAPSGFAKPTKISNVLCDFLDIPHGELIARTDVTKKVTQYIKKQNLQVPENKRRFIPDTKLGSILSPLDGVKKNKHGKTDLELGYTYFNLQKYLSWMFIKTPKKTVVNSKQAY